MKKRSISKKLEEFVSEKCMFLFDSSIMNVIGKNLNGLELKTRNEKTFFIEKNIKFLESLRGYIQENGNFFITNSIIDKFEHKNSYPYQKTIKREGNYMDRDLLILRRTIVKFIKEQRKTLTTFSDNQKILVLKEEERDLYNELFKKYLDIKEKHKLSSVDYDFLLTGITLAKAPAPITFLSNNFRIFYAAKNIIKKEDLDEEKVRFFVRIGLFEFRNMEMPNYLK